jgi:diguanylate cyclase (GGDEF)-like protein/PAS domain S-box-containing protein
VVVAARGPQSASLAAGLLATVVGLALLTVHRRRAHLLTASLLDAVPQPIFGIDLAGRITFANRAFRELQTDPDVIGRDHHELLHGTVTDPCRLCALATDARERTLHEITLHPASGRSLPVELRTRPISRGAQHTGTVITFWDVSAHLEQRRALEDRALTDPLTGVSNRSLLRDRLEQALRGVPRAHASVAVLLVDLDGFKDLNDTLGHATGDEILRIIARRLSDTVRGGETIARIGGDEFVVVVPGLDRIGGEALASRLLAAVTRPLPVGDGEAFVTASIGVAITTDRDLDPGVLLANAELAMYSAKGRRRGQVALYRPDLRDRANERLELGGELHRALAADELIVHYQPTWDLTTMRITGAEALLRWHHPTRGLLLPASFLPLTEQNGLIVPMGRWVLEQAGAQLEDWHVDPDIADDLILGVNLSVLQLREPGIVETVRTVLERGLFAPWQLLLEVTETLLLEEGDEAIAVLSELRDLGVRIAIDDFGTGFSSLSALRHLPIDTLKIDRSFVSGRGADREDRQVVGAIIELAHGMELSVIAEGVELEADLRMVRDLGCESAQGYGLARPASAEIVTRLLRHRGASLAQVPGVGAAARAALLGGVPQA